MQSANKKRRSDDDDDDDELMMVGKSFWLSRQIIMVLWLLKRRVEPEAAGS
jgi:hypothetical protein